MKILIIEDEKEIVRFLTLELQHEGYETEACLDGRSGLERALAGGFDLILLDVMLPGIDGITLLQKLKEDPETREIPVVMATAKGAEYDKIQGLDLGADYYLTKPFGVMEFVSCVKAVLRRCQPRQVEHLLKTGGLIVNIDEHTVTIDGERITLTYKEFELLRLFLSHPGMAFTRDQLFNEVWGMDYCGDTRTVDMHIRTLRQKLKDYGELIETVRNVGYRLEAKS